MLLLFLFLLSRTSIKNLRKTQSLQKARFLICLLVTRIDLFILCSATPYHACPTPATPARTRTKKGTTLVENISAEAAGALKNLINTITITGGLRRRTEEGPEAD